MGKSPKIIFLDGHHNDAQNQPFCSAAANADPDH